MYQLRVWVIYQLETCQTWLQNLNTKWVYLSRLPFISDEKQRPTHLILRKSFRFNLWGVSSLKLKFSWAESLLTHFPPNTEFPSYLKGTMRTLMTLIKQKVWPLISQHTQKHDLARDTNMAEIISPVVPGPASTCNKTLINYPWGRRASHCN